MPLSPDNFKLGLIAVENPLTVGIAIHKLWCVSSLLLLLLLFRIPHFNFFFLSFAFVHSRVHHIFGPFSDFLPLPYIEALYSPRLR